MLTWARFPYFFLAKIRNTSEDGSYFDITEGDFGRCLLYYDSKEGFIEHPDVVDQTVLSQLSAENSSGLLEGSSQVPSELVIVS